MFVLGVYLASIIKAGIVTNVIPRAPYSSIMCPETLSYVLRPDTKLSSISTMYPQPLFRLKSPKP